MFLLLYTRVNARRIRYKCNTYLQQKNTAKWIEKSLRFQLTFLQRFVLKIGDFGEPIDKFPESKHPSPH